MTRIEHVIFGYENHTPLITSSFSKPKNSNFNMLYIYNNHSFKLTIILTVCQPAMDKVEKFLLKKNKNKNRISRPSYLGKVTDMYIIYWKLKIRIHRWPSMQPSRVWSLQKPWQHKRASYSRKHTLFFDKFITLMRNYTSFYSNQCHVLNSNGPPFNNLLPTTNCIAYLHI